MVGPRDDSVRVQGFLWDYAPGRNVEHIARHGVRPEDVEEVRMIAPRYFSNIHSDNATHLMIGPNRAGRYLRAAIVETLVPGIWDIATAHWLSRRRGAKMYVSE